MSDPLRGWHRDPFGRHEYRYFAEDVATDLVRDGTNEGVDSVGVISRLELDQPAVPPPLVSANIELEPASTVPRHAAPHVLTTAPRWSGALVAALLAGAGLFIVVSAWISQDRHQPSASAAMSHTGVLDAGGGSATAGPTPSSAVDPAGSPTATAISPAAGRTSAPVPVDRGPTTTRRNSGAGATATRGRTAALSTGQPTLAPSSAVASPTPQPALSASASATPSASPSATATPSASSSTSSAPVPTTSITPTTSASASPSASAQGSAAVASSAASSTPATP